jgi:hypothetical protein
VINVKTAMTTMAFRFSDLPREYFKVFDSTAIVEIFDEKNCLLKRLTLDDLSLSNELLVNQDLLDGCLKTIAILIV